MTVWLPVLDWLIFSCGLLGCVYYAAPWSWFAAGLSFASLLILIARRRYYSTNWLSRLKNLVLEPLPSFLILFLISILIIGNPFTSSWIDTWDHNVHFEKILRLKSIIIEYGTFWGWSNERFAGYPVSYHYPIAGYLIVLLVDVLFFGLLDLAVAYNLVVIASYALLAYSIVSLARLLNVAGAGFLMAIFSLFEIGGMDYGGWQWHIYAGVWPSALSIALGILFVSSLLRFFDNMTFKGASISAMLSALALLSHPLQIIHLGVVIFCLITVYAGSRTHLSLIRPRILLYLLVTTLLLSSLWYLPYLSVLDYATPEGTAWESLDWLGFQVLQGGLIPQVWPLVCILALCGLIQALFNGDPKVRLIALMPLVLVFTATSSFFMAFGLDLIADSFNFIRFSRFISIAKPYVFALAGFALINFLLIAVNKVRLFFLESSLNRYLYAVAVGAMLMPVILQSILAIVDPAQRKGLSERFGESLELSGANELFDWLVEEEAKDGRFFRYAIHESARNSNMLYRYNHEVKAPEYRMFDSPAFMFKYELKDPSPELLNKLSVRYMISLLEPEELLGWEFVNQFGSLKLYENQNWQAQWYSIIEHEQAEVVTAAFGEKQLELKIDSSTEGNLLQLHISGFSRWHAEVDSAPLNISERKVAGIPYTGFMTVPLLKGIHNYTFSFKPAWQERVSPFLFLLGCILLLAPWVSKRT